MNEPIEMNESTGTGKLSLKVFGVGSAGCNIAEHLQKSGLSGAEFIAVNTDSTVLSRNGVSHKMLVGRQTTGGLGAGGEADRGRSAIRENADDIEILCQNTDLVFVLAGLGGGTGTGAAPIIAARAKEAGALVICFVTLPFELEGRRKEEQAKEGLSDLKKSADGVICLPNQKVFKLIDESASLVDTFSTTNEYVAQGVRAIWKLVSETGELNVDFADLRSLIRSRHAQSSFATVEAGGSHRIRDAVDNLVKHPLLEEGKVLSHAEAVLVSISGASSLSMAELTRLTEQLHRHCEKAEVKIGANIDDTLGDQIIVTLIAANSEEEEETIAPIEVQSAPAGSAIAESEALDTHVEEQQEFPTAAPSPVGKSWRRRGKKNRAVHPQLPLDMIPKGRFDKSEPTLYKGEDLDVPTFVRRGMTLSVG
tara:strand:+ start:1100 stop:2368 length:1269 start_codon:yes stop_codon:yes gene_type:complete